MSLWLQSCILSSIRAAVRPEGQMNPVFIGPWPRGELTCGPLLSQTFFQGYPFCSTELTVVGFHEDGTQARDPGTGDS